MIDKVLVANRGEIARRIFRTCREMGISTVAVYSEPDVGEPHVREADEAVLLPGATPGETYLDIDAVLAAAKTTGADAIHPGYGFLAENAEFARAVAEAGLTWIGPPPAAIETMGSKLESKRLMDSVGIPIIRGAEVGPDDAAAVAADIGYPVLVKASAGGGGKGMRIVGDPADLPKALEGARREAAGAFGDDTMLLEPYLQAPRHIEVQVMAAADGKVHSLFERECSIQRRHQKIIEEAPSPVIDDATRERMGETAVRAATAVGYTGAGTVEFLYQDGEFFFLEMNTRLQVEHPVTEMVTGLDLVRMQILVASGEPLPEMPSGMDGHAIEARLYAEDPVNDFLPVTGRFHQVEFPDLDGLRVDAGVEAGSQVSVHYDPLLAKVIAHAPTREAAAGLLATALRQARLHGSTTNRSLLVRVLEHPEFLAGETDTHFLQRHSPAELGRPLLGRAEERLAAVAVALADQAHARASAPVLPTLPSGWRNLASQPQRRQYRGPHATHEIWYSAAPHGFVIDGLGVAEIVELTPGEAAFVLDDVEHRFAVARYGALRYADSANYPVMLEEIPRFPSSLLDDAPGSMHAPMPGKVIRVDVEAGDEVAEGQVLVVLEAMKMEHTLRAPHDGTISEIHCSPGDQVEAGAVLVVVE
ncbi:MAG: ATP-grasp domain-containing protein [Actinobacteria bacterium]|nr:ATP-grasp domain-containing protein [Actinomycetota bacterium]